MGLFGKENEKKNFLFVIIAFVFPIFKEVVE